MYWLSLVAWLTALGCSSAVQANELVMAAMMLNMTVDSTRITDMQPSPLRYGPVLNGVQGRVYGKALATLTQSQLVDIMTTRTKWVVVSAMPAPALRVLSTKGPSELPAATVLLESEGKAIQLRITAPFFATKLKPGCNVVSKVDSTRNTMDFYVNDIPLQLKQYNQL